MSDPATTQTGTDVAAAVLNGETSYQQICGVTNDEMESAYSAAYTLFETGKYEDAERVFQFLALFDGSQPKYWLGLGGCREAQKNFVAAADAYLIPVVVNTPEPQAPFRAAVCCQQAGLIDQAKEALEIAILWADSDADSALIKAQAESMLAGLNGKN